MPSVISDNKYLTCPVRGIIKTTEKDNKDVFTEEFRRIELVKFLISKNYPIKNISFEKIVLKYGSGGRNTLKTDLTVYDSTGDKDINNIVLVAEVKKHFKDKEEAIEYQLKPAINNLPNCFLGIYWDDEDRTFYRKQSGNSLFEYSILKLPKYDEEFEDSAISFNELISIHSPAVLLRKLEQKIHNLGGTNRTFRYKEIFKIFLLKYFDENKNINNGKLDFQILKNQSPESLMKKLQNLYKDAVIYYSSNSPIQLEKMIELPSEVMYECVRILQDYSFTKTNQLVVQEFFMYFAPSFLRKELDQYYTPQELVQLISHIVEIDNVKTFIDPCGGSADFMVGLIKKGIDMGLDNIKSNAYCWDISRDAVNVASLNMILNGDGRTNIKQINSIKKHDYQNNSFDICITNPPFGKNTVWDGDEKTLSHYAIMKDVNTAQKKELGVLFIERCINLLKDKGILAIVLPNGYLTNPTHIHVRKYLLGNTRIIGCVSLPESIFKKSDANGYTDILFIKKEIIKDDYKIFVSVAEKIGFEYTKKKTPVIYKRLEDGNFLIRNNKKVIDNDLELIILSQFKKFNYDSNIEGLTKENIDVKYSYVMRSDLESDRHFTLSSRRFNFNYRNRDKISSRLYTTLKEIDACVSNRRSIGEISPTNKYIYLDTGQLFNGQYKRDLILRGWELPNRAKISLQYGDILIAKTKGCFKKFCFIVEDNPNLIATNGTYRIRIKNPEDRNNFFAFLFSDFYIEQMISLTTGTILADVKEWDLFERLLIPKKNKMNVVPLIKGFENLVTINSDSLVADYPHVAEPRLK